MVGQLISLTRVAAYFGAFMTVIVHVRGLIHQDPGSGSTTVMQA